MDSKTRANEPAVPDRRFHPRARLRLLGRSVLMVTTAVAVTILGVVPAGASGTPPAPGPVVSAESSPFGQVLVVGSGQFTGYSLYEFDRGTAAACSTKTVSVGGMALSCSGAETDKSADWPALTTSGRPVAGPGVKAGLLGSVYRRDLRARQVTYGGHLLYLFDIAPHMFAGEDFVETVLPLPPWHGLWYLVAASTGRPAPGVASLTPQTLVDGRSVLAATMFPAAGSAAVTVYTYSKDPPHHSNCSGACALTWPPVLTTSSPVATGGLAPGLLGLIRRSNGTRQVTYKGKPLYFYSLEVPRVDAQGQPLDPATTGNGDGVKGPGRVGVFSAVTTTR